MFLKKKFLKKSSISEEIAAPKSNFCVEVVTLKKWEKVVSPKIKLFLKSHYICKKGNGRLRNVPN